MRFLIFPPLLKGLACIFGSDQPVRDLGSIVTLTKIKKNIPNTKIPMNQSSIGMQLTCIVVFLDENSVLFLFPPTKEAP